MGGNGSKDDNLRLPSYSRRPRTRGNEGVRILGIADNHTSEKIQRCETKLTLYKRLIRTVVFYGHETWTMLVENRKPFAVFEWIVLRTVFGGIQISDRVWRRS